MGQDEVSEMTCLMRAVYGHVAAGHPIAATDMLVGYIDDLMYENEFGRVRVILAMIDADRVPPQVSTGVLMVTWYAKEDIGNARAEFFERVVASLETTWRLSHEAIESVKARLR